MEGKASLEKTNLPADLAGLRFARFQFRLQARERLLLPPYKGSALRGGFGEVFRRIACPSANRDFDECLLEQREFAKSARAIETGTSALRWIDWDRDSNRQQRRVHMGGFVGQVTYRGDFTEFFPYLLQGMYTHVGKGATFGWGSMK